MPWFSKCATKFDIGELDVKLSSLVPIVNEFDGLPNETNQRETSRPIISTVGDGIPTLTTSK